MGSHLRTSADSPPVALDHSASRLLGRPVAGREAVHVVVLDTWLSLGRRP